MRKEYEDFLKKVAADSGMDVTRKEAFMNPLSNDMFARLLSGALTGLDTVAIATFDFKLVAISKMLRAWYDSKMEELQKERIQTQYGADAWDEYQKNPSQFNNYNNYGGY